MNPTNTTNVDSELLEYAKKMGSFLELNHPDCILIPTESNRNSSLSVEKGKNPAYSHKNKTSQVLWDLWKDALEDKRVDCFRKGLLIILRKDLIVIDIDDHNCVLEMEEKFPIMKTTATQKTSKGMHYFFKRSEQCEKKKLFDSTRKLENDDGSELPIDIKTVCSTGTGGVISIYPSKNKTWVNPLYSTDILTFPDDLFKFIIDHHKGYKKKEKKKELVKSNIVTIANESTPIEENTLNQVKHFSSQLSTTRSDNYANWINLGHCFYNIHPSLLNLWIDFSKQSSKYKDGECALLWEKMSYHVKGFTMGSLVFWAKEDAGSAFVAYQDPSNALIVYETLDIEKSTVVEELIDIDCCNHPPRSWSKTKENLYTKLLPCHNKTCLINKDEHDIVDLSYIYFSKYTANIICLGCHKTKELSKQKLKTLCNLFTSNVKSSAKEKDDVPSDYDELRECLVQAAREHNFKKVAGFIYRPLADCPCAFEVYKDYEAFINEYLASHPLMKKNIRRFDELMKYLTKIDEPDFPFLVRNRNVISFTNGILFINERSFIEYANYNPDERIVARHHINQNFHHSMDTPQFDAMLEYQFEKDVCRFMYFMIGKMFFKVREKENYSIMPYLYGMGQTGKSTVINVVSQMFQQSEITTISENSEAVFGLQGKWNKEVMLVSDCSEHFSKYLDQTIFQKMVSGEPINIPQKGLTAIDIKWDVPIMIASNFYLDYKDSSQQISRRVVMFHFKNFIAQPDPNLEKKIIDQELSSIIWKSINTYLDIIQEANGQDFWQFCPQYFKDSQLEVRQELNYITRFLTASPEENCSKYKRYYVLFKQGNVENLSDVKSMFLKFMAFKHPNVKHEWKADYTPFKQLGYKVVEKNICKSCKNIAVKGCCREYHTSNRSKKTVIENIKIVEEDIYSDNY